LIGDPIDQFSRDDTPSILSAGSMAELDTVSVVGEGQAAFNTTSWSMVVLAGSGDSDAAHTALARLCRIYWYPLYAYVRRKGHGEADAQDLVQGFFAQLLERGSFARVARDRGRFRSFLLGALNYYLADQRDFARAQKRGGQCQIISIDAGTAEERYNLEPSDNRTPEQLFDRRWAMTVLETALARLKEEYTATGKDALFDQLHACLLGDKRGRSYSEAGGQLGMSESAVKMAAMRLRRRYQEILRERIQDTVCDPADVDQELRDLMAVVSQ
jgi:RNA polymerase sigma-70 factor (ECF subfamily)